LLESLSSVIAVFEAVILLNVTSAVVATSCPINKPDEFAVIPVLLLMNKPVEFAVRPLCALIFKPPAVAEIPLPDIDVLLKVSVPVESL